MGLSGSLRLRRTGLVGESRASVPARSDSAPTFAAAGTLEVFPAHCIPKQQQSWVSASPLRNTPGTGIWSGS